ncbi:MAG: ATP-binding protein, partial [Pseudomonadales bacterium]
YTGMLLEDLKDEEMRNDIQQIRDAATRASGLIQQLLAFGRSQKLSPKNLDINEVITSLEDMLRRLIGEDIRLVTKLSADLGPIRFDPSQIEQIIVNLAINARDAMPQGGQLLIQTDEVELDEDYVRSHTGAKAGPHIVIAVSDTGNGMSAEVRGRIFEPFFSTKLPGKGTGLGLSTVFGIVKQSGGNIWVYSEPGQGTTFKVYLPYGQTYEDEDEPVVEITQRKETTGRILVVEDDDHLRNLVQRILEHHDYRVVACSNPNDAIALCEQEGASLEVLITDVVMPIMSGALLAERIKRIAPHIRVVYMSGYTDDSIENHGILDPGRAYLEKPFTANQLLEVINRAK